MLDPNTPDPRRDDPIARLVRDLPEDSPSMAWRAGLNERLRAESTRRTRVRRWSFGSLGLGLATASFVACLVLPTLLAGSPSVTSAIIPSRGAPSRIARPAVEADDLLALDREGSALAEYSGAGLAARESDLTEGEVRDVLASQML